MLMYCSGVKQECYSNILGVDTLYPSPDRLPNVFGLMLAVVSPQAEVHQGAGRIPVK